MNISKTSGSIETFKLLAPVKYLVIDPFLEAFPDHFVSEGGIKSVAVHHFQEVYRAIREASRYGY